MEQLLPDCIGKFNKVNLTNLTRPAITLTSVQTRFERQGKFLNFYEVYEYFRKIFLFLGRILIFHFKIFFYEFSGSLRVFSKDFSN